MRRCLVLLLLLCATLPLAAPATDTENYGIAVLPAPGKVTVDGKADDWDLSGGTFECSDVERLRDEYAAWVFAMYDAAHVYVLVRWLDPTPLSHPGSVKGSYGFQGDCLQVRFITAYETPTERTSHWTCWRDRDGDQRMGVAYGRSFKDGTLDDARAEGGQQAFLVHPDGRGYTQELAIPWKLITTDGQALAAGDTFRFTVELNFTRGQAGRITMKGIFLQGVPVDRIFAFRAYRQFGLATLARAGQQPLRPVRLADAREFPAKLVNGQPEVDWTGLIKNDLPPGFKPIAFTMPLDGYVSLNLYDAAGKVVRHLLTQAFFARGAQTVSWDGLTTPYVTAPGEPVAPGAYTWKAIALPGIHLELRGWAHNAGSVPWNNGPTTGWGGNHGTPVTCAADGQKVYLGWSYAEGPSPLLAVKPDGKVQWRCGAGGKDSAQLVAVGPDTVYAAYDNFSRLFRLDVKTGSFTAWAGTTDTVKDVRSIWPDPAGMPTAISGMAAVGGKLYLSFAAPTLFTEDAIADWPALFRQVKAGAPPFAGLYEDLRQIPRGEIDKFLKDQLPVEKVSRGPFLQHLNRQLASTTLAPDTAKLAGHARALVNRAVLEQQLGKLLRPERGSLVAVLDGQSGKLLHTWDVNDPTALAPGDKDSLLAACGATVCRLALADGKPTTVIEGLTNARGVAADAAGKLYVLVGAPDHQVRVYGADGKFERALGKAGGRQGFGPWDPTAMQNPAALCVDATGKVWVAEDWQWPKRFVVWDPVAGTVVAEHFGPTHYGASGGAINPRDPSLLVGSGCEWRLDPKTGRATCLGVFRHENFEYATFREGSNGRLYLFGNGGDRALTDKHVAIYERLGDGQWALRARLGGRPTDRTPAKGQNPPLADFEVWSDLNGDGQAQPDETQRRQDLYLDFAGSNRWSMNLGPDLALYGFDPYTKSLYRLPLAGFSASGAPRFDLAALTKLPDAVASGYRSGASDVVPAAASDRLLAIADRGRDLMFWECYNGAGTERLWTYPNPFFQVHGSHRAPGPRPGLFRGAYGIIGTAKLPAPLGNVWFINTNCGEWHVLNEDGFYVTRLFEPDPFRWEWPEVAVPGAGMDAVPCGGGGEDFGGSVTQTRDGQVFLQSGHAGYWSLATSGWDQAQALPGGTVTITDADVAQAQTMQIEARQRAVGRQQWVLPKRTVELTGNLKKDFGDLLPATYKKQDRAGATTVLCWDAQFLYVGWDVEDSTPWVNGAKDPAMMFVAGDTVDLQLRTDATLGEQAEDGKGDVRISIGNYQGKPTVVVYRRVWTEKQPRTFSSGVVAEYKMDYVAVAADVRVVVPPVDPKRARYTVEAAIPLALLGLAPKNDLKLRGDFGVTHGDPAGENAVLRTFWSNQDTGLLDDVVFELKLAPKNWGELIFKE